MKQYNIDPKFYSVVELAESYELLLPEEVCDMSKSGLILGYELLRWGEEFHNQGNDSGFLAAIANRYVVGGLALNDNDRTFINEYSDNCRLPHHWHDRRRRENYIYASKFCQWDQLGRFEYDYFMSLLWLPEIPLSPLEALGRMAHDT